MWKTNVYSVLNAYLIEGGIPGLSSRHRAGGGGDDLIAMLVDSASLGCSELRLFLRLLLNLSDLLPLL